MWEEDTQGQSPGQIEQTTYNYRGIWNSMKEAQHKIMDSGES